MWQPLSYGRAYISEEDKYLRLHGADILAEEMDDKMRKPVRGLGTTILVEITKRIQVGREDGPGFSRGTLQCQGLGIRPGTRKCNRGQAAKEAGRKLRVWHSGSHRRREGTGFTWPLR